MKVFHSAKHNTDYYPFRKPADVKNHNFLAQTLVYSRARKSHDVKLTCRAALWDTFISSYSSATQHFKHQPLLTTKSSCQQITWKHSAPSINSTTLGIHNTANWLLCLSKPAVQRSDPGPQEDTSGYASESCIYSGRLASVRKGSSGQGLNSLPWQRLQQRNLGPGASLWLITQSEKQGAENTGVQPVLNDTEIFLRTDERKPSSFYKSKEHMTVRYAGPSPVTRELLPQNLHWKEAGLCPTGKACSPSIQEGCTRIKCFWDPGQPSPSPGTGTGEATGNTTASFGSAAQGIRAKQETAF
ncbi:hypothetical protein Anapl_07251 [Anas platyrhynchos]|uniref:Uncharacterized protein n=1 Tax=Anas platyrhynchos TaxID=8839 RepID=R0JX41_ANAPL|nr:hypothetical protein Anapl_07251 [Anas platyrhynchos]